MASHLVETSEEDSFLAVVAYIGELLDAGEEEGSKLVETPGSRFVDQCKASSAAENYAELLEQFAANLDLLYSKSASDQDLEGSVNIICHLVPRIPAPGAAAAATHLSGALAATPSVRPDRRLQALINLYNVVWEPQSKLAVLRQALAFSTSAGLADVMLGLVRAHADSWAADLHLSAADERGLYVACAEALATCTRKPKTAAKEAYRLLCKHLATYEGATPAEAASAVSVAAQVVCEFLRSPDLFQFDLADNPAVAALTGDAKHAPLHALLGVYLSGSVADFRSFAAANPAVFSELLKVAPEAALGKMQLLALMGLAHGKAELSFGEIASALDLPLAEVESAVVQAIGKRLMEARIDQLQATVAVSKCAPRTFGAAQWVELRGQLRSWRESVTGVLSIGKEEAAVLPRGIAELSVSA